MTHFGRLFDGVVAWGLVFLLAPDAQPTAIGRLAGAVASGRTAALHRSLAGR